MRQCLSMMTSKIHVERKRWVELELELREPNGNRLRHHVSHHLSAEAEALVSTRGRLLDLVGV